VSTSAIKESKRKGLTVRKKQKHCKTAKEEVEKQTQNDKVRKTWPPSGWRLLCYLKEKL